MSVVMNDFTFCVCSSHPFNFRKGEFVVDLMLLHLVFPSQFLSINAERSKRNKAFWHVQILVSF